MLFGLKNFGGAPSRISFASAAPAAGDFNLEFQTRKKSKI